MLHPYVMVRPLLHLLLCAFSSFPFFITKYCSTTRCSLYNCNFFFQAEDGIRDGHVTGVQTCALPISLTRRLILQKARRHPSRLRRIVSTRFQVLFHSPPGVLFTFPSRYLSAIGHKVVFRLTRWSWPIHTGFHGPGATREHHHAMFLCHLRGSHPLPRRTHHDFHYPHTSPLTLRQ